MFNTKFIIHILRSLTIVKSLHILFLISMIQVADLYLSIYLSNLFGEYLILGSVCLISLVSLFVLIRKLTSSMEKIERGCSDGELPMKNFNFFTGILAAAVLLIAPGFISDFMGFLILIPPLTVKVGALISRKCNIDWYCVYEYMKI